MPSYTFYPDPNVESTSVDGLVARSGIDEVMGTIRAGAGVESYDDTGSNYFSLLQASATSNQFKFLSRGIYLFDTSTLSDSDSILSATFSLYFTAFFDGLLGGASANSAKVLVASTPASNTALVNGDYSQLGAVDFGRTDIQDNLSTGAYTDITINATGRADISKTGVTKYGIRVGFDLDNTITGLTWSANQYHGGSAGYADNAGTTQDPKLVVTYASAGPANLKTYNTNATANVKTINTNAIANVKTLDTNV